MEPGIRPIRASRAPICSFRQWRTRPFRTRREISFGAGALLFGLLIVPQACTNLDETPLSLITPGNFFHTEPEVLAGLAGVYAQLRSTAPEGGLYDANEVSSCA